jgi:hypothetical protein
MMIIGIRKVFKHKAWEVIAQPNFVTHVVGKYPSMAMAMKVYENEAKRTRRRYTGGPWGSDPSAGPVATRSD